MITETVKETVVVGNYTDTGVGTKGTTVYETVEVTKTPLEITKISTSQRDKALELKDFRKVEENLYVRRFDENMSQRMLFVKFGFNNLVTVINRPSNLSLGETIFEGKCTHLEDFIEYLD